MYSTLAYNLFPMNKTDRFECVSLLCVCVSQQDGYICDPGRSVGGPGFTTG